MNVVVLGATQGMGQALARQFAQRGDSVFLLGRNAHELELSAQDLQARSGRPVAGTAACDLMQPAGFGAALEAAQKGLGRVDTIVVTAALFDTQEKLEADAG